MAPEIVVEEFSERADAPRSHGSTDGSQLHVSQPESQAGASFKRHNTTKRRAKDQPASVKSRLTKIPSTLNLRGCVCFVFLFISCDVFEPNRKKKTSPALITPSFAGSSVQPASCRQADLDLYPTLLAAV